MWCFGNLGSDDEKYGRDAMRGFNMTNGMALSVYLYLSKSKVGRYGGKIEGI